MKHPPILRLLATLLLALTATAATAYNFCVDGIYYNKNYDGKSVSVTYKDYNNGNYGSYSGSVTIPEKVTYGGITYPVTGIASNAFRLSRELTSVTIPNSVTWIGDYAFNCCSVLTSVIIPNSVDWIGDNAFSNCHGLTSVTIPSLVTKIGYQTFCSCSGLTSVTIPNSVITIGGSAFDNCWRLTSIFIPNSVTEIGAKAFSCCSSLTSVVIPSSVTTIGDDAFLDCTGLVKSTYPNHLKNPFKNGVVISYSSSYAGEVQEDGSLYNLDKTSLWFVPCNAREFTIPSTVSYIGLYAFYGCKFLATVDIPNSVTSIGNSAFRSCIRFTTVTIPNSVTSIGNSAFQGCSGLTTVTIPNSVTSIGDYAFAACSGLIKSAYPDTFENPFKYYDSSNKTTTYYGVAIAYPSDGIKQDDGTIYSSDLSKLYFVPIRANYITIPETVTSIGDYALYNCKDLVSLIIPKPVKTIGKFAFSNSTINSVVFGAGLTSIGSDAFTNCNITKAFWLPNTPPSGCSSASATIHYVANDQYTFSNQTKYQFLSSMFTVGGTIYVPVSPSERTCDVVDCTYSPDDKDIVIEDIVTNKGVSLTVLTIKPYSHICNPFIETVSISHNGIIDRYTFENCTALKSVMISNKGSVEYEAFKGCTSLTNVTLAAGVTSVGHNVFDNCVALRNLTIADGDTPIILGLNNSWPLFEDCDLDVVYIGRKLLFATSKDAHYSPFYNNTTLRIVEFNDAEDTIYANEFAGCSNLSSIKLGNNISSIGEHAFSSCSSLGEIIIPDAVTTIGESAFTGCTALENVCIGKGVPSLPQYVFYGCSSLPSLSIPNNVGSIEGTAFSGCTALSDIIIEDGDTQISLGSNGMSPLFVDCPLDEVYIGRKLKYSSVSGAGYSPFYNNAYLRVVEFNDAENTIYANEFSGCRNLNSIKLGNNISSIGQKAFYNCWALGEIIIPDAVTTIGASAFEGCEALANVSIGNSVPLLPTRAFYGCTSLGSIIIPDNIASIGTSAFEGCRALANVSIGNSVPLLPTRVFYGCTSLGSIIIPDNIASIGTSAFESCTSLENVNIGQGVSLIEEKAFFDCSALVAILIPDAVTAVGTSAFEGCVALENVSIGKGVTSLPRRVFYGCSSLPSLTIPNNVASVDNYAFGGCTALSDLTIEDAEITESSDSTVEVPTELSFDDWTSTNHNHSSTSYKEYSFVTAVGDVLTFNYSVSSESGYDFLIIKLNGTQIVKESGTKSGSYRKEFTEAGSVTLYLSYTKDSSNSSGSDQATVTDIRVNDVQTVDSSALTLASNGSSPLFVDCPLDEVYIGRKLRYSTAWSAGYSPFYRNTSLRAVEITDAETEIYDNEFYGCTNLQTLKIGNGVKTIGKWAFSGCSSLEYFSAGFEVESIGQEAFSDCTGLTSYYSYSVVPPTCGDQALDDINKWECTLYIPATSADEYMTADQWKEFFFMSEMDAVLVAEILLNCNEFVLSSGDTFQLTAEVLPVNVTDPSVVWSSSNPEVATVDDNGLVTAVAEGFATITAASADGNAMATADVEVKINTGIEDVTIDGEADIEVYNAAGVKMGSSLHNLVPGVYFVRQGTKVTKVVVK